MRDSMLVQEDEVGDQVIERRRVQSLLQLASDNILEKFVPPRSNITILLNCQFADGPWSEHQRDGSEG